MNLRELKSHTYGLLNDASQQAVNFGTIVGYLNIAQTVLGNLLWNVDREKFLSVDKQTTAGDITAIGGVTLSVTTATSDTVFIDTALDSTDYLYREIQFITATQAANVGARRVITAYDTATKQITVDALPAVTTVGDTYKIIALPEYPTPVDLREIVRVTLNGFEATRLPVRDLNAIQANTLYRGVYPNQIWYSEMEGTAPGKTRIRLSPPITSVSAGTRNLEIWYYRRPMDFHVNGTYDGVATGVGTTSTILDTNAPYNATATAYTDFWKYAQVRMTSGNNEGIIRRVSSQTLASSTITLDTALPTATTTGDTYELDQVSILPEHVHYLMPYYAAGLAASKVGMDGGSFLSLWNSEIAAMGDRLVSNVEVNIPGEVSQGVKRARM